MYCVVRDVSTIWRGNTSFGYPITKQCDSWKKRVVDTSCGFSLVECGELEYKMFYMVECSMWQGGVSVVGDGVHCSSSYQTFPAASPQPMSLGLLALLNHF